MAEDSIQREEFENDLSMTFQWMNLSSPLLKVLTEKNYPPPTPIQAATIPIALTGRDIYGCATRRTGKAEAYLLPVLERLHLKPNVAPVTRVLVILPTYERARQTYLVAAPLARFCRLEVAVLLDEFNFRLDKRRFWPTADIIIAYAGALIDHLANTPLFSLHYIEILILDDADRMNENIVEQMKGIIKQCPYSRQTMLFCATLNDKVEDLAASCLKDPVEICINRNSEVGLNLHQEIPSNREAISE